MLKIPKVHMDNSYEVGDGVAFKGFINACQLSPQAPVIFSKHYYTPLLTVRTITFENDATEKNSFVKSLHESSKRLTGKPVKRKDPVDSETLQTVCETYKDSTDLLVLRNLTV